jgi:hypothetical protein
VKVLMLSRYGRLGASSRVRLYQYLPWLEAAGIAVTEAPFFSDAYVDGLQRGRKDLLESAAAYAKRLRTVAAANRFDLLWIEKELMPWLPGWFETALLPREVPYVLDYDDAVFHYYDQHRNAAVRVLLAGKHPGLMRRAALVVAGNEYLAGFSRASGAKHVSLVPTVVDLRRYPDCVAKSNDALALPCVGWIGQRATAASLAPYSALFKSLAAADIARFAAVGIDARSMGLPMDSIVWSEATEVTAISQFDIGIMPLADAPFERGKCGYKLIQYMACGLPVIASPVGVNRKIVEHGVNGFLAETHEEWESALRALLDNADLRNRMGRAGRRKVEQQFCLQVTGPRMASLMQGALQNVRKATS